MATASMATSMETVHGGTVDATASPGYIHPFDDTGIAISATLLLLFLVLGVIGNSLTIMVIAFYRELRDNVFTRLLLSLCVSDLISAMISWLFLYRRTWGFDGWNLPGFLCQFFWGADVMTSYSTAFHIFTFAVLRYVSIKFPHRFRSMTMFKVKMIIAGLWSGCILFGFIPLAVFSEAGIPDRASNHAQSRFPACTLKKDTFDMYKVYARIAYSSFLFAPGIGIILMSALIIYTVKQRAKRPISTGNGARGGGGGSEDNRKKENQAVVQLLLIAALFLLGYVPFAAYELWGTSDWPPTDYYDRFDYWFGMSSYICLRFSECLNPLFYNLGSAKMRFFTRKFVREHVVRRRPRHKDVFVCTVDAGKARAGSAPPDVRVAPPSTELTTSANSSRLAAQYGASSLSNVRSPSHNSARCRPPSEPSRAA